MRAWRNRVRRTRPGTVALLAGAPADSIASPAEPRGSPQTTRWRRARRNRRPEEQPNDNDRGTAPPDRRRPRRRSPAPGRCDGHRAGRGGESGRWRGRARGRLRWRGGAMCFGASAFRRRRPSARAMAAFIRWRRTIAARTLLAAPVRQAAMMARRRARGAPAERPGSHYPRHNRPIAPPRKPPQGRTMVLSRTPPQNALISA